MVVARGQITITRLEDGKYYLAQYTISTSQTIAPTIGWAYSPISPKQGEYLWQRTGLVIPPATVPATWNAPFLVGSNGSNGEDAVVYSLMPSTTVVKRSTTGVLTPTTLSCIAHKKVGGGSAIIAPTSEVFIKYRTSAMSALAQYSLPITLASNHEWVEFELHNSSGLALDKQTVQILSDSSDMDIGYRNLVLNSDEPITNASYLVKEYTLSCDLVRGKTYTIVLKGSYTQGSFGLWLNRATTDIITAMPSIGNGLFRYTFTINFDVNVKRLISIYNYPSGVTHNSTIEWIKLVEGNTTSNDWVAAPEDFQAEYKSYIEATDKRLQAIFTQSSIENLITKAMASGKCVYPDASFTDGVNGISTYSNSNTGTLTVSRVAMPESPTGSKFGLKISSVGPTTPGRGGVYQRLDSRANAIFIQRIIARIPKGYSIRFANNNIGLGAKIEWLTSSDGTGDWHEYILCITCGSTQGTSSFNTCGHIYIGGGTFDVALEWEIALMTAYDVTGSDYLVNNKLLNSVKNTLESNITANANAIATKVSRTDYDSNNNVINSQFTEIKQTASNVSLKVNAIESFSNKPQGMRNYALGTEKIFEVSGFASASNVCVNTYKVRKEVTGGDVCLAFDIELIGCTFASNSTINLQGDYNWDYNAGVIGWGKIPAKNGKIHVFAMGNIPTKTNDNYIQIRLDYVKGGTMKISNFIYAKGNKEVDWSVATEDQEAKMIETGIDIENRKLTFTADNTTFKDNNGNIIALFDEDGINAALINAKLLRTEKVICLSIDNTDRSKRYMSSSLNMNGDGMLTYYSNRGYKIREDIAVWAEDENGIYIEDVKTVFYNSDGTPRKSLGGDGLNTPSRPSYSYKWVYKSFITLVSDDPDAWIQKNVLSLRNSSSIKMFTQYIVKDKLMSICESNNADYSGFMVTTDNSSSNSIYQGPASNRFTGIIFMEDEATVTSVAEKRYMRSYQIYRNGISSSGWTPIHWQE